MRKHFFVPALAMLVAALQMDSALAQDIRRDAIVEAVAKVRPSVVNISTARLVEVYDPWADLFGEFFGYQQRRAVGTQNPNFKNVVLHVVWDTESIEDPLPLFVCKKFLDAPLPEIASWLGSEAGQKWPRDLSGQCCAPLRELPAEKITELLRQAALVRFQRKALELEFRARQAGWEQALWEGLLRALGYKQNIWPMRRMAELLPFMREGDVRAWQAQLLGISGLLPDELRASDGAAYQRQLWDIWWRERGNFTDYVLPKGIWKFSNLRPANHPQRRLALAAHWLSSKRFLPDIENWFTTSAPKKAPTELLRLMQVPSDEFWSRHFTFRSAELSKAQPLIGDKRITDLAINVILPWFWIRSVAGKNLKLQRLAEEHYFAWPAAEDNSVLRLARHRLLSDNRILKTAADQQGLLQIVRDFCEHSDALCTNCRFPDLVRQWNAC